MSVPADVKRELLIDMKARARKGFPGARGFTQAEYVIDNESRFGETAQYYAYNAFDGYFFESSTAQTVFDAVMTDITQKGYTGGVIFIKRGSYTIAWTISRNGTTIVGEGKNATILTSAATPTGHTLYITANYCIVKDLSVATTAGGGTNFDPIHITGNYSTVENCRVNGSDRYGVYLDSSVTWLLNNYIYDSDSVGIFITGQLGANIILGNDVYVAGGYGISLGTGENIIEGNYIDTTGDDGIYIPNGSVRNTIQGNYIESWTNEPIDSNDATTVSKNNNCGGDVCNSLGCCFSTIQAAIDHLEYGVPQGYGTVWVPTGTYVEHVIMTQNAIRLIGLGGAVISGATISGHVLTIYGNYNVVRDIQIMGRPGGGQAVDGVVISGCYQVRLQNVSVYGSDLDGIHVFGTKNILEGHVFNDCFVYDCDGAGISLVHYACGVVIGKNIIEDTGGFGIYVASGGGIVISDNFINTTGDDGINLSANSSKCIWDGNRIGNWTNECYDNDGANNVSGINNCL